MSHDFDKKVHTDRFSFHKLTQIGQKCAFFAIFFCLWQLPMYQKSTEFFLDPHLKRFSENKLQHKLTQNGPKICIFRNFQTHYLGSTRYVPIWQLPMYQKSTKFFLHLKRYTLPFWTNRSKISCMIYLNKVFDYE